ncbi:MAG TPA: hypothetical protein VG672_10855, partial [Bryobacteraceae bacterium]|nr:hypothetical protein [Bryobacteraceae bacterium]
MSDATLTSRRTALDFERRPKRPSTWVAGLLLLACLLGAVSIAKLQRRASAASLSLQTATAKPVVNTVLSKPAPPLAELVLPGNTEAVVVADIYARATGYVRS